jgi:23S rRNA pseudouridine1911/1915/1917 synthase
MNLCQPFIIKETDDYAVVFKPPKMHSAPLKKKEDSSLFDWFRVKSSHVFDMVHRLDYETHGLVLFAKNKKSFEFFKTLQDNGEFIKEYSAICVNNKNAGSASGFPPSPVDLLSLKEKTLIIESFFRPYGPGRKLVRPVTENKKQREIAKDKGGFYKTEITDINGNILNVRIKRGFRHQIRCHLCWVGFPIQNDPLYPYPVENDLGEIALRSHALIFKNPANGENCECRIESILEKPAF